MVSLNTFTSANIARIIRTLYNQIMNAVDGEFSHLFRIENPNIYNEPDGIIWHENVRGQWFFDDIRHTRGYIHQVTVDRSGSQEVVDGAQLVIAHVPTDELQSYKASNHPIASELKFEEIDYIIPRDGGIPTTTIGIDWLLNRLRYDQNWKNTNKAQRRIEGLTKLALLAWNLKR